MGRPESISGAARWLFESPGTEIIFHADKRFCQHNRNIWPFRGLERYRVFQQLKQLFSTNKSFF